MERKCQMYWLFFYPMNLIVKNLVWKIEMAKSENNQMEAL